MAKEIKVEKSKLDAALRKILSGKATKSSEVKPEPKKPSKIIKER